jgi:hypothetical protein
MRENSKLLAIASIIGILTFLLFSLLSEVKEKETVTNRIKTIPTFTAKTLDNIEFSKDNLMPDTPSAFLYFNSECDFCKHEAKSIRNSIFVSSEPLEKIRAFSKNQGLYNKSNIVFLQDATGNFSQQFNAMSVPYTLAYDKNQKLIKTHRGQLSAKGILKIFDKNSYE